MAGITPSQTVGPFFHFGLTDQNSVHCIAGPEAQGERISLQVHVFDGDGARVLGTIVGREGDYEGSYALLWPYVLLRWVKARAR